MSVLAVYREPFGIQPEVRHMLEGLSLAEMAERMGSTLPAEFPAHGIICVNGRAVHREWWPRVRPKAQARGKRVEVTFHCPPRGGGGEDGGGKQIFALLATIALIAITGGIAANGIASLGIKGGTLLSRVVAAGVGIVGSMLIAGMSQPPTAKLNENAKKIVNEGAAAAEGNVLEPNGPVPRVVGQRKVYPPLACEPFTYYDGRDEVVEAVFCLAGPHQLTDIRVGQAPIADVGVEYEVREGWPGDFPLTLVRRQSRSEQVQQELVGHAVDDSDGRSLASETGGLADALPQPYLAVTRRAPDVHQLQIAFPQGLHEKGSETVLMRVPIRIRIRAVGEAVWRNLPEIHFQAANLRQLRATIQLEWSDDPASSPSAVAGEGFVEARRLAVGQSIAPVSADWVADPWFGTSGDEYMSQANLGSTGVLYTVLTRYTARFVLGTDEFPPGRYEVEIRRGAAFYNSAYVSSAYTVSGTVWDLFGAQGTPGLIVQSRDGISDSLYLVRSVSIWNEHPVPTDEFALIAVRARNRSLESVSCVAGGWVQDWDGVGWREWAVTSNPAAHLRDVWCGRLNSRPVPLSLLDSAGLVEWRAEGYSCNAVIEDQSVLDAAAILTGSGYARPYMSEVFGVVRDYDRSAEAPVQIFTPRNSSGFRYSKGFARLPDGLRVTYRDELDDYNPDQFVVARPGFVGTPRVLEQVTYEGPTTQAAAAARARYDLLQSMHRSTFYTLEAPVEAIVCRRGSLVGVQHDMLTRLSGSARIIDWQVDGAGEVTHLVLDSEVEVANEDDVLSVVDMLAVEDVLSLGQTTGVAVRGPTGVSDIVRVANASGSTDVLELEDPLPASVVTEGGLVAVGGTGQEYLRLIVFDMQAREDGSVALTLVDEAPQIWAT